ncbi:hypothetical protein ACOSQ2_020328 [Xanthoceras sorbifolium]
MQLFPERVIRFWSGWEVRLMVLLSLVLQIILIIFGARRKITARIWIRILVWSVYMSADWVATVALGNLASNQFGDSDQNNNTLQAFWAPFLLLHLGGSDTITAYAWEDNELWKRHLLGLVVQVGVAFYVFLLSWSNSAITFINIPVFISGIIKYCERNIVLRSSSADHFRDSLLSSPDPCQEFVAVVEKDKRGQSSEELEEGSSEGSLESSKRFTVVVQSGIAPKDHYLVQAYFCFTRFKYLVANIMVDDTDWECIYSTIKDKDTAADAFEMVAVELGFMYDVFYTKAAIVYSQLGIFLRCISFICSLSALVLFSITIDVHAYSLTDISITYLLLVGAVVLEIYAFLLLLSSDWTKLRLIKLKKATSKTLVRHFWRLISDFAPLLSSRKRWSGSIGQHNLISYCLRKVQPTSIGVHKLPFVSELLAKYWYFPGKEVNINNLEETIFKFLKHHGDRLNNQGDVTSKVLRELIMAQRGNFTLKKWIAEDASMWTVGMEFIDSLVIWHIATDLLYYEDLHNIPGGDVNKLDPKCKVSKYLSDYMLYLLVFCPSMLPLGFRVIRYKKPCDEIRYENACDEAISLFKQERPADIYNESRAWKVLLKKYPQLTLAESLDERTEMARNVSLLKHGCLLSRQLRELTESHGNRKWEVISDVWVEMLAYAADHCGWKEHTQQLRKGGEFLTHVYLLMAHFGFTRQYAARKPLLAVFQTEDPLEDYLKGEKKRTLEDYLKEEREINRETYTEDV